MIHLLETTQIINTDLASCWKFFSDPKNLARITPPELDFVVKSTLPDEIYEGMMIEYRVRPLFGIQVPWLTEITKVRAPHYFVDEQRVGPYAVWHHEHEFHESPGGAVRMVDRVHYVLPFAPFSEIIHPLLVAPQLGRIFDFRKQAIAELFPG
ncbi:MAG: SRPBCC family protein [Verrucomicrobiia bacterium]